ncbi:hypothetical protein LIER_08839 [Lithospermum erythrorhizon]|uniref:C3H1-type domain-containing protein n=1 Tax=Lithospermum erythrorhizon TaxID=34254 RepID=A0AAV3PFM6_LITER
MNHLTIETEDTLANFLEFAANNDVEGCRKSIDLSPSSIHEAGLWYGRQEGSKSMVLQKRTPLLVASMYGSIDVLKLLLSLPEIDVNHSCGEDKKTALHCAASGGSVNALKVVTLLLSASADPNLVDADGRCPHDIIVVPPNLQAMRCSLEKLLMTDTSYTDHHLKVSTADPNSNSPPVSPSSECRPSSFASVLDSSPKSVKVKDIHSYSTPEKKEYPVDPTLPDIKNSIYSTDEFRMFSFKVRPCSRAYSHDWTECPFVHPGENARRRDPRKFHYSCVPCPDFRKGSCRRGDMCEYAHGVFECWLHPAQYKTRLCKDGTDCDRRVCFFAHIQEEIRPLYHSTGSAVPSPGSTPSNMMDFAAAMSGLPGSPSSISVMSPSPFTPPMSPSIGMSNMGWPQPHVPALHLPGSNLQYSRLRSSINARDIPPEDLSLYHDFDMHQQHLANDISHLGTNCMNRSARSLTPLNLEDNFSTESSSPRYHDHAFHLTAFSPTHKSAVHQFQQQQQNIMSPIDTNFSPKNGDHPLLQGSYVVSSPGRMSPRHMESTSPMSSQGPMFSNQDRQHQPFRSLSSRDLGFRNSDAFAHPVDSLSMWDSFTAKPDWAATPDELARLRRSNSFELANNREEPDLSWVQSVVRESPQEMRDNSAPHVSACADVGTSPSERSNLNSKFDHLDPSSLDAWLEKMNLD